MSTGSKVRKGFATTLLAAAVLFAGNITQIQAAPAQSHRKPKPKKQPLPPLPSGPTGPVQQMPLDTIAAVPPQVSFQNNELTIVAPNSTLADILRAVRKQTGAEIEVPSAPERVVTHLGPGPARDVLSDLLNGSRFNYVMLGSPGNDAVLTRVVLVPKAGQPQQPAAATPAVAANSTPEETPQPPAAEAENAPAPEPDPAEGTESEANDDSANNGDDSGEQPAEAEQQAPGNPDQPGVKTPQQMLQEMQQRQLQLQQQQQNGQPVTPGSGMPPHPPQQQQQ